MTKSTAPQSTAPARPVNQVDPLVAKLIRYPNLAIRRFFRNNITPRFKQFLYKYRAVDHASDDSVGRLRAIVVESQLWLSGPNDFNDPFDHAVKVVAIATDQEQRAHCERLIDAQGGPISKDERARILATMLARRPEEAAAAMQQIVERNVAANGVYSFAGDPRNLQMWSYYANEHRGICIQFDIAQDPENLIHVHDAEYSDDYPHLNCFAETAPQVAQILIRKHSAWKHEQERRLVLPDGARTLLSFAPKALTGIILGCRLGEGDRLAIDALLRERAELDLPRPRIFEAVQHNSKYRLVLKRLRIPGVAR